MASDGTRVSVQRTGAYPDEGESGAYKSNLLSCIQYVAVACTSYPP